MFLERVSGKIRFGVLTIVSEIYVTMFVQYLDIKIKCSLQLSAVSKNAFVLLHQSIPTVSKPTLSAIIVGH